MRKPSPPAKPEPEPEKFERWTAQRKAAIILDDRWVLLARTEGDLVAQKVGRDVPVR